MAGGSGKLLNDGPAGKAASGEAAGAGAGEEVMLMRDCPLVARPSRRARVVRFPDPQQEAPRMSPYANGQPVQECTVELSDGGSLSVTLIHGTGADAGRRCIHRVTTDSAGRLRSDIVYFYDGTVKEADIEADFALLGRNGLMSMSQLHHTESMLNRGRRTPRT